MPNKVPELLDLLGALLVSVISATAAITRRMAKGQIFSFIWLTSEFLTAILCGYLMYTAYPHLQPSVPSWFTLPIAVALTAHVGGRLFQEFEDEIFKIVKKFIK